MNNLFFIYLISLTLSFTIFSQSTFQRKITGPANEYGNSIIETTDGGYALAGYTNSFGAGMNDFFIVKLSVSGNTIQWSKTVGGAANDIPLTIIQTQDGYVVSGETTSFGAGNFDAYIVKLNNNGTILWNKTFGGIGDEYGESIVKTSDGGYAVGGYTNSFGAGDYDDYIAKLDAAGSIQWFKTYGTAGYDYALSIKQTSDRGYVLFGSTSSFGAGNNDYYVVKVDSSGLVQWSKTIGGRGGDYGFCVIQTSDGGYALSGTTLSFGAGNYDIYIVKLSAAGSLEWTRTIGGTGFEYGYQIIQTSEGGYAIAASIESFGAGGYDAFIVKLNSSGQIVWDRSLGDTYDDNILSITQTTDGGYAATGFTTTAVSGADIYIIKFDSLGNTCGNTLLPDPATASGGASGPAPTAISSPVPNVSTPISASGSNGTLVTNCFIGIQPISTEIPKEFSLSQNYPNPFNPVTKIKFSIPLDSRFRGNDKVLLAVYDVLGQEIQNLVNEELQPGSYEVEWNTLNYPSGIYFYSLLVDGKFNETKKMVLLK